MAGKSEKMEVVATLHAKFGEVKGAILSDYRGLNVQQMSELRRHLREAQVEARATTHPAERDAAPWFSARPETPPPPPPFEEKPPKPLFAPAPPSGRPVRTPRPGVTPTSRDGCTRRATTPWSSPPTPTASSCHSRIPRRA